MIVSSNSVYLLYHRVVFSVLCNVCSLTIAGMDSKTKKKKKSVRMYVYIRACVCRYICMYMYVCLLLVIITACYLWCNL